MDGTAKSEADRDALRFAMNLSLAVGLLMFAMKTSAYLLTGSAAILSDAAESVTHVAAVFLPPTAFVYPTALLIKIIFTVTQKFHFSLPASREP